MEDCSMKHEQNDRKIYLLFKTSGERRATKGDKRGRPSTTMGVTAKENYSQ